MNISNFERSRPNELFVIEARLRSPGATRKQLDAFQNNLMESHGQPPEWFNVEFWIMSRVHELTASSEPQNIMSEVADEYARLIHILNEYRPARANYKSLLIESKEEPPIDDGQPWWY